MGRKEKGTATTYQVRLTENAFTNIEAISAYIAFENGQPLNAINIVDAIFNKIDVIASIPHLFKECEQIPTKTKMYRQALCLSWYIVY